MSKEKIQNLIQYPEIFRLPIIVTQKDLKIEKEYMSFYNDKYWKKYKKQKRK